MISLIEKIRKSFSRSALQYEMYAKLQKEIGRELVKKIMTPVDKPSILDVGMGTGWLVKRLKLFYPDSLIVGIDFADGMIDEAKKQDIRGQIVQADARQLPFKERTFDYILSNLSFQWIADLSEAFNDVHRLLKNDGSFCATIFGHQTLGELFESLSYALEHLKGNRDLPIQRLNSEEQIKKYLQSAGFKSIQLKAELVKLHFADLFDLLRWLKRIGANVLERDLFIGPDLLNRVDEYYRKNFKDEWGVSATFEVIWVEAKKV